MTTRRRTSLTFATAALFAALLVGALVGCGQTANAATQAPKVPADPPDQDVVTTYFQILNAGMISGDFSGLATVYAPDATLTQSNPKGVTVVANGLTDITAWYQSLQSKFPGIQFTRESMRSLAPHVMLTYEHAGKPSWITPGRCMHVFTLKGGKIVSLDWATYFGGQPA